MIKNPKENQIRIEIDNREISLSEFHSYVLKEIYNAVSGEKLVESADIRIGDLSGGIGIFYFSQIINSNINQLEIDFSNLNIEIKMALCFRNFLKIDQHNVFVDNINKKIIINDSFFANDRIFVIIFPK